MTLYTLLSNYLTKATPQDNTLGIVFYNIFLWCIVSLSSILVFFLTSVKEGYILEIQMLIKYSLLHFIYLCKQIAIISTLVLATTCDKCNVFKCNFINKNNFINNGKKKKNRFTYLIQFSLDKNLNYSNLVCQTRLLIIVHSDMNN